MSPELEQVITRNCPTIFRSNRTDIPICFGLDVGDGWFQAVLNLSQALEKVAQKQLSPKKQNFIQRALYKCVLTIDPLGYFLPYWLINFCAPKEDKRIQVIQIKEKFGTLRYYIDNGTPEAYELIRIAEDETRSICEQCGEPGQLCKSGNYWVMTRCDDCFKAHVKDRRSQGFDTNAPGSDTVN